MRIPYDSECLAAVAQELRAYVGGKVQGVRQPNENDVYLALYHGGEAWFLIGTSAQFARAYLTTRRPPNRPTALAFCAALRARLEGERLVEVEVPEGERMLTLTFSNGHRLIAELMGKHSNAMLVAPDGRVVGAVKWVARSQSVRPVISGAPYIPPPVLGKGGGSPFLAKLRAAGGGVGAWSPVISWKHGAYPYSVAPLGLPELPRGSLSVALESYYAVAIPQSETESIRTGLLLGLRRVLLAREAAISDLAQAIRAGRGAGDWQKIAELILTYGPAAPSGAASIDAWDHDGAPVTLDLDPEIGWKENAERYFRRARKAKSRLHEVEEQSVRLRSEAESLTSIIQRVESAPDLASVTALREEAKARRWLHLAATQASKPEARPYEGHRIRELVAPGGWTVLYGENAEANDYLTLRVAKPDDIWLHVRGATSPHVVVQTRKAPEKVQRDALEFAARTCVRHSTSLHSRYVAVDYTLKKYVRKSRGAPKGSATYTHEKTLHVEGGAVNGS